MRKVKVLSKLTALVLSVTMAFSLSATASAAEVTNVAYSQSNANCEIVTIDLDEILATANIANPNARSPVSLDPSQAKLFNIGTLSAGQVVNLRATWTPVTSELHIGLVLSTASSGELAVVTGGSANLNATVPVAGTYYLMIANPSTTATLSVNYSYSK